MNGSGGFQADLGRITEGASEFGGFAEEAGKIVSGLSGLLDSIGACWGTDAVGQSFAAGHVASATDSLSRVGGLTELFGGVGERFKATAQSYTDVDEGNAGALRGVES
jgi:hypothetical protein